MLDPRLSLSRSPHWHVNLLSAGDEDLGSLDGVAGGSLEIAPFERLGGSATLTLHEMGQGINWLRHRVSVSYDPGISGIDEWPMGVFLFSSPKMSRDGMKTIYQVSMLTKLAIVDEDVLDQAVTYPAGTPIIPKVVELIRSAGETRIAVTPSDAVLRVAADFQAGESKLTVINALLEAAGYWSLAVSRSGQFLVEPYVDPASREPVWSFEAGARAIHRAQWGHDQDLAGIPNKIICRTTGTDEVPGIVGVATNENPDSDFSYQGRGGRWISKIYDGEYATQQVADQAAQQYLLDSMSPVSHYELEHAILPLDAHDVVEFKPRGLSARGTIQRISIPSFTFDAHAKLTIRQGGLL